MKLKLITLLGLFLLLIPSAHADAPIRSLTLQERIREDFSPRMVSVVECESNFSMEAIGHNTNGTYDIGWFQVNSSWLPKAQSLGYDVYTEEGNYAMALWIYRNAGGIRNWVCNSKVNS